MNTPEHILLKNGVRVLLVPQPQSPATTVMVFVAAGSEYETKDINGVSHFLEHMCFKGTKKRPKPADIAWELDGLGAAYNAFTGQEATSYFAKARNEVWERALEIVADLYINPVFAPAEIEKEKGVIVEEINMYEDLPPRRVQELFMRLVYGDQPAGWGIAGEKEVIRRLTRDDLLGYRSRHYLPEATVLVVAGNFGEKERALSNIERHFGFLSRGAKRDKFPVAERQEKPGELVAYKASDQTHLVLGFRAFGVFDERRFALEVLVDILGGGMGSRLFQKIREELGAAYYVHAGADLYSDHGLVAMSAGIDHQKIKPVLAAALGEFRRFREEFVGDSELKRAKDHLVGNLLLSLETSDELGAFYGAQEVLGMPLFSPAALAERLQRVTPGDIREIARAIFIDNHLNLAVIGPFRDVSFGDIVKME